MKASRRYLWVLIVISLGMIFLVVKRVCAQEDIQGHVIEIRKGGEEVVVNVGEESGLKKGDILEIFSREEVITIPGTGKEAIKKERALGEMIIVEVQKQKAIARPVRPPGIEKKIEKGLRVHLKRAPVPVNLPPHIEEKIEVIPQEPYWGEQTKIKLNVFDVDNDVEQFLWESEDVVFGETATRIAENSCLAPFKKGSFLIKVVAVDKAGHRTQKEITIECAGPAPVDKIAKVSVEKTYGRKLKHFVKARQLCADKNGNFYILDSNLRRIIKLEQDFSLLGYSQEFGFEVNYTGLQVFGGKFYLIDEVNRQVHVFEANENVFKEKPVILPLELSTPVDIRAAGENIFVLDKKNKRIQIYQVKTGIVSQIHLPGFVRDPETIEVDPAGDIFILDKASRKIFASIQGEPFQEYVSLPEETLSFCYVEDQKILILTAKTKLYNYKAGNLSQLFEIKEAILNKVMVVSGTAYVVCDDGSYILKIGLDGQFLGKWGGEDFDNIDGFSVNHNGWLLLSRKRDNLLWLVDPDGWVIARRKFEPKEIAIHDAVLGDDRYVYIWDKSRNKVMILGEWLETLGSIEPQEVAEVLAIGSRGKLLYILARDAQNVKLFTYEKLTQLKAYPVENFKFTEESRLFASEDGKIYLGKQSLGFITFSETAQYQPINIAGTPPAITYTTFDESGMAYFAGEGKIFIFEPLTNKMSYFSPTVIADALMIDVCGNRRLYILDNKHSRIFKVRFDYKR